MPTSFTHVRTTRRLGALVATLVAVGGTGCSASVQMGSTTDSGTATASATGSATGASSGELDTSKAQSVIKEAITASVGAGVDVAMTCPTSEPMTAGHAFDCTGTVAGQPITVVVTEKNDRGDVTYAAKEALVDLAKAGTAVSADATKQLGAPATAACPGPNGAAWFVGAPGATFTCTVTSAKGNGTAHMTVKDRQGAVTWTYTSG